MIVCMKTVECLWNKQNGRNELLSVAYFIASCHHQVLSLNKQLCSFSTHRLGTAKHL